MEELLRQEWSPEQVAGHLRRKRLLCISHETIYRHIWRDETAGGSLHVHLRGARKQCRKRYGRYDSRGRLAGKRLIGERPGSVALRRRLGDWEIDTVLGTSMSESSACILTMVERKSGYALIGKLRARNVGQASRVTLALMRRHQGKFRTITADNGTEFHGYVQIEAASKVQVLLRHPTSQLGTRHQRKHQRPHPPVPAQRKKHGVTHSGSLRRHRRTTQPSTQKKTCIQNTPRMLPSHLTCVALQS